MAGDAARPTRRAAPGRRRVPQRTCVGCRSVQPKRQLLRLVRQPDGCVLLDPTGKADGRGAYLHDRRACWTAALAGRALDQALKMSIAEAERARLRAIGDQYSDDET